MCACLLLSACVHVCACVGGMPRRLPASQAELEGPCWGWRVQASPLPSPAYWSMLGNSKAGGEEEGEGKGDNMERGGEKERSSQREGEGWRVEADKQA